MKNVLTRVLLFILVLFSFNVHAQIPPCPNPCPSLCSDNIACYGNFDNLPNFVACALDNFTFVGQGSIDQYQMVLGAIQKSSFSNTCNFQQSNQNTQQSCFTGQGAGPNFPPLHQGPSYIGMASQAGPPMRQESFALPLSCPLNPGTSFTVTFWARASPNGDIPTLELRGVANNYAFPGANIVPTTANALVPSLSTTINNTTNWDSYTATYTVPPGPAFNSIMFSPAPTNSCSYLYLDDVQIVRNPALSIATQTTNASPCIGSPFQVDFEICNINCEITSTQTFTTNFPGFTMLGPPVITYGGGASGASYSGNTLSIPGLLQNGCVKLTLNLKPDGPVGNYPISLNPLSGINPVGNNSINVDVIQPSFAFTKSVTPGPYMAGDTITYNFSITNLTGGAIFGMQITDALPAGFTFIDNNNPAFPPTFPYSNTTGATSITSLPLTIGAGATVTVNATVKISDQFATCGSIQNCASLDLAPGYFPALPCGPFVSCASVDIAVDPNQLTINLTQFLSCYNSQDAELTVSVNDPNSTAPYMYGIVSQGIMQTSPVFSNLGCGIYTFLVVDLTSGCQYSKTFSIDCPPPLGITSYYAKDPSCHGSCDGSISGTAAGGAPGYTWTVNTGQPINSLCAGNYTLIVTDANGCTDTQSVTLTEPNPINYSIHTVNPSCPGACDGEIQIMPVIGGTPPYQYSIDGGGTWFSTNTFTNLCHNVVPNYSVMVKDSNGCIAGPNTVILIPAVQSFWQQTSLNSALGMHAKETGKDIVVDAAGNVYATGSFFQQSSFVGQNTTTISSPLSLDQMYVVKFSPCGDVEWVAFAENNAPLDQSRGLALVLDETHGWVYVTGNFEGASGNFTFHGGNNSTATSPSPGLLNNGMFLAKYDMSDGTIHWVEDDFNSNNTFDVVNNTIPYAYHKPKPSGIAIDKNYNLYISGTDYTGINNVPRAFVQHVIHVQTNAFNPKKGIVGDFESYGTDVEVSSQNEVYLTGKYADNLGFGVTNSILPLPGLGTWDGYVAQFKPGGGLLHCQWILPLRARGAGSELNSVDLSANGMIYVTGTTSGDIEDALSHPTSGGQAGPSLLFYSPTAILARIRPNGLWEPSHSANPSWFTHADPSTQSDSYGRGIAVNQGKVFVTGDLKLGTSSPNLLQFTNNQTNFVGPPQPFTDNNVVFVAQFNSSGDQQSTNISQMFPGMPGGHSASAICANQHNAYSTGQYSPSMDFPAQSQTLVAGTSIENAYFTRSAVGPLHYHRKKVDDQDEPLLENKLDVYPNPTSGILTLASMEAIEGVIVHNLEGRTLLQKSVIGQANKLNLDLSNLSAGMYLIQVKTAHGTTFKRVLVNH